VNDGSRETASDLVNPFVGLRPYEEQEAHLFFGRDGQSDELVHRLARKRFLAVVGVSGSGKSSLVRAGLFAYLRGGFMAAAGSSWRIALLRPGSAPLASLAAALHDSLRDSAPESADSLPAALIEATLRRSSLGLFEAVRQAHIPHDENVLVVVDQFEELFRFKRAKGSAAAEADAAAFVKLLVEAPAHPDVPIYVMLTMRSDFLGDCTQFRGLPEALNESQYLIPRRNRDERRQAIEGPIGVGGARISPRLVQRLLNDVGEDPDQLPVLQHALMRTWQHWEKHRRNGTPLDLDDYEATGTMESALSRQASEAYDALDRHHQRVVEKMFKRLTERGPDNREIRRPTQFGELRAVAAAGPAEVTRMIDLFRNPDRSFLTPPYGTPLTDDSFVDISHESLIRKWGELRRWVNEESESRTMYARLADAAKRHQAGEAGLWRNPDLKLARDWFKREQPNAAWAQRYGGGFALAKDFLRRSTWRSFGIRGAIAAVALALVCLTAYSIYAGSRAEEQARGQKAMALVALDALRKLTYELPDRLVEIPGALDSVAEIYDQNMAILDQIAAIAGQNQATAREVASNSMRLGDLWFERSDLARARVAYARSLPLYALVIRNDPANPQWRRDLSIYHERMGRLRMAEGDPAGALTEYRAGLAIVEELANADPNNADWQQALSISHEKIGDVLLAQGDAEGALRDYQVDLSIAALLASQSPGNAERQLDLAISHERIAKALEALQRRAEAGEHRQAARQIRESLATK
jgi:tetratricopeptide (TPR) repeat protein